MLYLYLDRYQSFSQCYRIRKKNTCPQERAATVLTTSANSGRLPDSTSCESFTKIRNRIRIFRIFRRTLRPTFNPTKYLFTIPSKRTAACSNYEDPQQTFPDPHLHLRQENPSREQTSWRIWRAKLKGINEDHTQPTFGPIHPSTKPINASLNIGFFFRLTRLILFQFLFATPMHAL